MTGEAPEYRVFTPDLSLALVQPDRTEEPLEQPPLSPEATEETLYVRPDRRSLPDPRKSRRCLRKPR